MPSERFRRGGHKVEVVFDDFGWEALSREARLQGITVEELVYHAAIYYLAADRDQFSRRPPPESGRGPGEPDEPS